MIPPIPKLTCIAAVLLSAGIAAFGAENETTTETDADGKVALDVANWDDVLKLVEKHKGQVVVLNVWTTTCGKCREDFPEFIRLYEKHGRATNAKKPAAVFISVNCDYDGIETKPPEFYRNQVVEFLTKHESTCDNVILDVPFIDFLRRIELRSTPALLVYGRDGKLKKRFDNDHAEKVEEEFTLQQVGRLIEELIGGEKK